MPSSSTILWSLVAIVAVFAAINLCWRWASRNNSLPCPSWLGWMLEGRVVDWWAATERTLDRIGMKPGDRVLEVGPGPGRLLIPAAARVQPGGQVIGLDIQPKMIQRLNRRAGNTVGLTAQVGNAEQLPFPDDHFDIVYLCTVLGEIPDRARGLAECFRVLKRGGRLSLTELPGDPHFQSQSTVARLAAEAGFAPVEVLGRWYSFTANFQKPVR